MATFLVRRACGRVQPDADALDLGVVVEALNALLAAVPGHAVAAERNLDSACEILVDIDLPRIHVAREPMRGREVARVDSRDERKPRAIGERKRLKVTGLVL